jgi:hypothetical protein
VALKTSLAYTYLMQLLSRLFSRRYSPVAINFSLSFAFILALSALPLLGWAQAATPADGANSGAAAGQISQALALGLYCDARTLLTGNLGIILGMILVFSGLWSLVKGGSLAGALLTILIGGAVPSIPGLVEGGLQGLGELVRASNMSTRSYTPPSCGGNTTGIIQRLNQQGVIPTNPLDDGITSISDY